MSNLVQRVLAAAVFGPVFLALFWFGGYPLLAGVCAVVAAGIWEFYRMLAQKGLQPWAIFGFAAALIWCFTAFIFGLDAFPLFFTALLLISLVGALCTPCNRLLNAGATLFGVIYVGFLGSFILLIRNTFPNGASEQGAFSVLLLLGIWANDIMAYFSGRWFGKKHPFPTISPSKTEAGFIGGFAAALLIIGFGAHALGVFNITQSLILGLIVGIGAPVGDLVESMIKRDMNVKDTSELIPGHGGMLDRFDSVFFVFPCVYLYLLNL
ncbi:MAG: phosphatidate cytidylyltransferase [Candidatus Latescibacteria bacterium]|jgi:phosphatidate cytidylyltransferase|nr:phosphatidate cytidylyltransferase [Candidatus Latescibacterota bacterium]